MLYGGIGGDIIGSPFEFRRGSVIPSDFELFADKSQFTDDTVLTIAVAECILKQVSPDKSFTMACIAGNIAEAYYGSIPEEIRKKIESYLPDEFIEVLKKFEEEYGE